MTTTEAGSQRPSDTALTIGLDVGGSKVAGGVVDTAGRVLRRARRDTPGRSTEAGVVEDVMVAVIEELEAWAMTEGHRITGVGVGAAGFVSADGATVLFAPHLSWRDEPVRDRLVDRLQRAVVVDNDANAAAWAEYRFGAGRGEDHLVMLTLGTGIGGAIMRQGRLQRGAHGLAGEFGHMQVVPQGRLCECGNRGCWEQYSSGRAMRREAVELVRSGSPYAIGLSAACGDQVDQLEGHHVTAAALQGDRAALDLLADVGDWLGAGLASLAAALDPGVFVIGGGVSQAGETLLEPARTALARRLTGRGHRPVPPIRAALLGTDAGMIGAADLARVGRDDAGEPAPPT